MKYIKLEKADTSAKYVHGVMVSYGYESDSINLKIDLHYVIIYNLLSELWQPSYNIINDDIELYTYETH